MVLETSHFNIINKFSHWKLTLFKINLQSKLQPKLSLPRLPLKKIISILVEHGYLVEIYYLLPL